MDDRIIRDRIIEEIDKQPWAPQTTLDIYVYKGVVRLRGLAADERVRAAIRVAAENVPGVREVKDEMRIAGQITGWA